MAGEAHQQFISFTIGAEEYGIDIMAIREIKGWAPTTPLPEVPEFIMGVIDLRGAIVPIVDLRARFHHGRTDPTRTHVIIVVAAAGGQAGLLADAVVDIVDVAAEDIHPVPQLDTGGERARFLTGLVTVAGRMVALLDLNTVIGEHARLAAA
ncbi:MAG: chemotaxis protein CheW [Actinomycetota bacterium]